MYMQSWVNFPSFKISIYSCVLTHLCSAFIVNCQPGWTASKFSGSCVKLYTVAKTWEESRDSCKKEGADLLRILDSEMNAFIATLLTHESSPAYIGLKRFQFQRIFTWRNPNNQANYISMSAVVLAQQLKTTSCVVIDNSNSLTWMVSDCSTSFPYFCEKGPEICPASWTPSWHSGTCIKLYRIEKDWFQARGICHRQGAELVTILEDKMDRFIDDQVSSDIDNSYWIGLNDLAFEGEFMWPNRSLKVDYTRWASHQPKIPGDQHNCVMINYRGRASHPGWHDTVCALHKFFICEQVSTCDKGSFGKTCSLTCDSRCNPPDGCKKNGDCISCLPGLKGLRCQDACHPGTYGESCSGMCSLHCADSVTGCDKTNGTCLQGCREGYEGACVIHAVRTELTVPTAPPSAASTAGVHRMTVT
ncbi:hypothetical protein EGW08_021766 [Elysia chlorotica]|uniref:C-type lectin domain-containing protein n=1 Tax=Elysia chlorotica TaxID=188477 RepID=A0A433SMU8_ELYCH|nr:hypothetical protein EGW08_021766 [Elysia chlorotica]